MKTLKKVWDICNVEIISGVLFLAAVGCCLYDGNYSAAFVAALIVAGVITFGFMRYHKLTFVVPIHSFFRCTPPKAKGATKNKGKKTKAKSRAKRPAKKKSRK